METDTAGLRARLQAALGEAYVLERELGGGGMSRVFLASDERLARRIVVKVLAPELAAGLSAARFEREIRVSARLQHPHVVPVHASGKVDGLPYYTMPYVEGESLRERLRREGALPVADTVRLVRELADALAYAHARGIVHRDLKPENVLLSDGHAVVADFGVAKALATATEGGVGPGGVTAGTTGLGVAVGTPAYMAPEQAAADPALDHRADLYALGVIAYEALAGRHPFAGRPPQAMLAAHLTETPAPLADGRSDVPRALEALILRLLAKAPDARPQRAVEVIGALDGLTPVDGTTGRPAAARLPRRRIPRRLVGAGLALVLGTLAAGGVWWAQSRDARPPDAGLVVVAPFRVAGADPSLAYLREGMLDLLAAKLTGEGGPRAVNPRTVMSAWRRGASDGDLAQEPALTLAQSLGAGRLVLGEVVGTPGRLVISATLLAVPGGRPVASGSVAGPPDSLLARVDELAAQLLTQQAGETERLAALTSASLPALRAYLDGQAVYRRGQYGAAMQHHERALRLDSTFAVAALGLAEAANWGSAPGSSAEARHRAWVTRSRLDPRDRAYLELMAGSRYPAPTPMRPWIADGERFVAAVPDRPGGWSLLGDHLMHYGNWAGVEGALDRAAHAFGRALALDSTYVPALGHLVVLAAHRGDTAAVRDLGALFVATDSTGETADVVRWRRALMLGDDAGLARVRRRLSGVGAPVPLFGLYWIQEVATHDGVALDDATRAVAAAQRQAVTPGERFSAARMAYHFALERGRPAEALRISETVRESPLHPRAYLRWRVIGGLYAGGDSLAAAAAAAALAKNEAVAPEAAPPRRLAQDSDRCVVALWRLAHGDGQAARLAATALRSGARPDDTPAAVIQNAECAALLEAGAAVAARRPDAGALIARLDSLPAYGGEVKPYGTQEWGALALARLKEAHGDLPGALRSVRRRGGVLSRLLTLAAHLREEGRLAALTGDRSGAIRAYRHYLALRADPEPPLRAEVAQVRAALARLERESAGR